MAEYGEWNRTELRAITKEITNLKKKLDTLQARKSALEGALKRGPLHDG